MKEMWDQRYAGEDFVYGREPNPYFREQIEKLSPGRILLPGEGEGRNAVFAAKLGWQVAAFDQSAEGRRKALQLASDEGVHITYDVTDVMHAEYMPGSFDLIALLYLHLPAMIRRDAHRRMASLLRPEGVLLLEGFSTDQTAYDSGGPKDVSMLFDPYLISEDFKTLRVNYLEKTTIMLAAGRGHSGPASVVRFAATR